MLTICAPFARHPNLLHNPSLVEQSSRASLTTSWPLRSRQSQLQRSTKALAAAAAMRSWCDALEPSLAQLHGDVASASDTRVGAHKSVQNCKHSLHRLEVVLFNSIDTGILLPKYECYVDHDQEDRELQNYLENAPQPIPPALQQYVQLHVDYVQQHVGNLYVDNLTASEPSTSEADSG